MKDTQAKASFREVTADRAGLPGAAPPTCPMRTLSSMALRKKPRKPAGKCLGRMAYQRCQAIHTFFTWNLSPRIRGTASLEWNPGTEGPAGAHHHSGGSDSTNSLPTRPRAVGNPKPQHRPSTNVHDSPLTAPVPKNKEIGQLSSAIPGQKIVILETMYLSSCTRSLMISPAFRLGRLTKPLSYPCRGTQSETVRSNRASGSRFASPPPPMVWSPTPSGTQVWSPSPYYYYYYYSSCYCCYCCCFCYYYYSTTTSTVSTTLPPHHHHWNIYAILMCFFAWVLAHHGYLGSKFGALQTQCSNLWHPSDRGSTSATGANKFAANFKTSQLAVSSATASVCTICTQIFLYLDARLPIFIWWAILTYGQSSVMATSRKSAKVKLLRDRNLDFQGPGIRLQNSRFQRNLLANFLATKVIKGRWWISLGQNGRWKPASICEENAINLTASTSLRNTDTSQHH